MFELMGEVRFVLELFMSVDFFVVDIDEPLPRLKLESGERPCFVTLGLLLAAYDPTPFLEGLDDPRLEELDFERLKMEFFLRASAFCAKRPTASSAMVNVNWVVLRVMVLSSRLAGKKIVVT